MSTPKMSSDTSRVPGSEARPPNTIVRRLKPPPEIWELVQPVAPRERKRTSTSLGRVALISLGILAVGVGVTFAFLTLRNSQSEKANNPTVPLATPAAQTGASVNEVATPPAAVASEPQVTQPPEVSVTENVTPTPRRSVKKVVKPAVPATAGGEEEQTATRPVTPNQTQPTTENESDKKVVPKSDKSSTTLSPQLIAPAKASPSPKAKVIPWP